LQNEPDLILKRLKWQHFTCSQLHAPLHKQCCENTCQAKFLTCAISDFTPCTHAQSNILHIKYVEKTDD